jgi:hypothetical protein
VESTDIPPQAEAARSNGRGLLVAAVVITAAWVALVIAVVFWAFTLVPHVEAGGRISAADFTPLKRFANAEERIAADYLVLVAHYQTCGTCSPTQSKIGLGLHDGWYSGVCS